jgi:cobalt-precorrin 5A hydrolase
MGLGEAMIVGGVGCRKGVSAAAITAAIEAACAQAGVAMSRVGVIATAAGKEREHAITQAAAALGVPLVLVSEPDLRAAGARVTTHSPRVMELIGVPSVAEAAALAAGGPAASLLSPRIAVGAVTCALAETERAS